MKLAGVLLGLGALLIAVGFLRPVAVPLLVLGTLPILFAAHVVADLLAYRRRFSFVKVYEDGIALPWRDPRMVRSGIENFLPFTDIVAAYPNEASSLPYVTVQSHSLGLVDIEKEFIGDLPHFLNVIGRAVTLEPGQRRAVPRSSILFYRTKSAQTPYPIATGRGPESEFEALRTRIRARRRFEVSFYLLLAVVIPAVGLSLPLLGIRLVAESFVWSLWVFVLAPLGLLALVLIRAAPNPARVTETGIVLPTVLIHRLRSDLNYTVHYDQVQSMSVGNDMEGRAILHVVCRTPEGRPRRLSLVEMKDLPTLEQALARARARGIPVSDGNLGPLLTTKR